MKPNEIIGISLGSAFFGVLLISLGLAFTLGFNRTWWRTRLLFTQEGYLWTTIPLGITALLWAVGVWFPRGSTSQDIFFWGGMFSALIAFICSLGPPRLLKPKWLRDLEDRHPGYTRYLRERARQLSGEEWLTIVHDPERLEQWADAEVNKLIQEQ